MRKSDIEFEIESALINYNKNALKKHLKEEDMSDVVDVFWDYILESKDSYKLKEELEILKEKIKTLSEKSGQRTRCIKLLEKRRALISIGPLKEEVLISPNVDISQLKPGTEVLVIGGNDGRILVEIKPPTLYDGRLTRIKRIIDKERALIEDSGSQFILKIADWVSCKEGDEVRYDLESQMILEVISVSENNNIVDLPKQTFEDVKGLEEEKKFLYERIIYPTIYKEKFKRYGIKPIKGILLHGIPGCGKSYIAGAIFNEMMKLKNVKDINNFFVINGPELLNKWAGATEESIRKIFKQARINSKKSNFPSIIFWDEIESVAGKRKDSATYSPEKTIVPTLLTELQGISEDNNVILICATNMPQLLDPALLRPGRLGDIILEIPRPTKEASKDIINSKFKRNIPEILKSLIENNLTEKIINHIYSEKPLATTKTKTGKINHITRQEMVSGALFANIGEEIVRKCCIEEIRPANNISIDFFIKMIDDMFLSQLGILDSGVKNGFEIDPEDIIIDVAMES